MPAEKRQHWKLEVDTKWNAPAAAGHRKVIRDEVKGLRDEWAEYRKPLELAEQAEREERVRKRRAAREAEEARAAAQLAEDREKEAEKERQDDIEVEPEPVPELEVDSGMMEEPAEAAAPVDPPSPAVSTASTRGGKKGKGKGKGKGKAPAPRKPKVVEVLTLDDDSDDEVPATAASNGVRPLPPPAPKEVPVAIPSKKPRGGQTSTFGQPGVTTTSPRHSPSAEHRDPTEQDLPPPPVASTSRRSSHAGAQVDVDPSGDLETPEPHSQEQAQEQEQEQAIEIQPAGADLTEHELPPKKRRRQDPPPPPAIPQQPVTKTSTALGIFAFPLEDSNAIADAERIARQTRAANEAKLAKQPTHTRFDRGADPHQLQSPQQASTSQARLSSGRSGVSIIDDSQEDPLAPKPRQGERRHSITHPISPRHLAHPAGATTDWSVEIPTSGRSSTRQPSRHQQQQIPPPGSSPVQVVEPSEAAGRKRGRQSKASEPKEPIEEMVLSE